LPELEHDLFLRAENIYSLNIEFDGSWLTVSTDAHEVFETLKSRCRFMLSDPAVPAFGHLGVYQEDSSYRMIGESSILIPTGDPGVVADFVVEEILLKFMRARKEFLWLHAAAVERGGKAIILAGESGQGKSTVSTFLCSLGWRFMSDDVVALRLNVDEVIPFPLTPRKRVQATREFLTDGLTSLSKEDVDLDTESLRRAPTKVGAVVFPMFRPTEAPRLDRTSRGHGALELLSHTRNIVDHGPAAATRIAELMRRVDSFSLRFGFDGEGIQLISSEL
jgi:hypothetical protein